MGNCQTCPSADKCYSAHASVNDMQERLQEMGVDTVFDRYKQQQPQCGFGMQGVCCQLCSHGPCRITPKAPRAICGATADTIVARNLVRLTAHGAAAYSHHLEELAKTIKATAAGKTPFRLEDEAKLKEIAKIVGLDPEKPAEEIAVQLADTFCEWKDAEEPLPCWSFWHRLAEGGLEQVGLFRRVHSEIRDALTKTMSNINTDPVDLLLTGVRLALATGYMGLVGTITLQDILLGTPKSPAVKRI